MKKYIKILICVTLTLFFSLSLIACDNSSSITEPTDNGSNIENPPSENITTTPIQSVSTPEPSTPEQPGNFAMPLARYEAVPLKTTSSKIVYSATDNQFNYYVLLLGASNLVPIASETANYYNGQTPITLSFTKETITENTIKNSVSQAVSQTISVGSNISASIETSTSIEATAAFAKASASIKAGITSSISSNLNKNHSSENTYSTAQSTTNKISKALTYTIGEHGESVGKYRLALFATVDMYLVVKLNTANSIIYSSSATMCARPETYTYVIDYDTDINGNFNSTSNDKLKIPTSFTNLPKPTKFVAEADMGNLPSLTAQTAYLKTTSLSCGLNNGFNYDKPDKNGNNVHYSHQFSLGDFVLDGGHYSDGELKILNTSPVSVSFRLKYDADSLPIQDTMTSRRINSYGSRADFYNMPFNVGNRTVGKGMLVATVQYADNSPSDNICITNVFDGKKAGDTITIKADIKKACTIKIAIVYEVVMWAPGFLGISDDYWMQWRINQTINIVH